MTEPGTSSPSAKSDWLLIAVLVALVLPLRLWLLCNTEVTARDSIGYIRYALQFEQKPWNEVLKDNHQHPGYPVLVWLTSLPVRAIDGQTTPDNLEWSAQLVNLAASLLLIVPMYFLGRQFFDRTVSFWAVILYQYLPISAQHLSDGISEPMYLVLMVSGLLQAVHAVNERTVWRCTLCGLFTGLAYLTRPEGALALPAFATILAIQQIRTNSRGPWRQFFACGAATVLAAVLIGSIYVAATGRITNKLSAIETLKNLWNLLHGSQHANGSPLHLFAVSFAPTDDKLLRIGRSLWALVSEVNQGFHYVAAIPALLGLFWSFGSLKRNPGFWLLIVFGLLHCSILIALAMSVNYVSDRHVMILVLVGCYFAVAGLRELPRRLLSWGKAVAPVPWYRAAPAWFAILLVALFAFCLPKTTQRLHGNRAGNHAAGLWLAQHVAEGDHIEDDHAWSHFFSGMLLHEGENPQLPANHVPTCYVVTTRSRDPEVDRQRQAGVLGKDAKVEYVWPERVELEKARIVIYSQPRDCQVHPWRKKA